MKAIPLLVFAALLLGACDPGATLAPSSVAPICKALIGPIPYNSTNKASERYAARVLAMDLKERNRVGRELGCPLYKR